MEKRWRACEEIIIFYYIYTDYTRKHYIILLNKYICMRVYVQISTHSYITTLLSLTHIQSKREIKSLFLFCRFKMSVLYILMHSPVECAAADNTTKYISDERKIKTAEGKVSNFSWPLLFLFFHLYS